MGAKIGMMAEVALDCSVLKEVALFLKFLEID